MLQFPHNRVLSAARWTPRSLGGPLVGWYDAASAPGANGESIDRWTDLSGRGNDATQSGAARPTIAENTLDTRKTITFNGTSQYFALPNIFAGHSAGSCYYVIKCTNDPNADNLKTGLHHFGTDFLNSSHFTWTDGDIYEAFGTSARKSPVDPTPALTSWRIYHVCSASNDWAMYLDGVSILSTGTNTVGFEAAPTLGRSLTTTIFFDGRIAEAIYTAQKESTADRERVEGYLAHKYGLQANLPATHPYRTSRP